MYRWMDGRMDGGRMDEWISDISNFTNLQRIAGNKKYKKVYETRIITR